MKFVIAIEFQNRPVFNRFRNSLRAAKIAAIRCARDSEDNERFRVYLNPAIGEWQDHPTPFVYGG